MLSSLVWQSWPSSTLRPSYCFSSQHQTFISSLSQKHLKNKNLSPWNTNSLKCRHKWLKTLNIIISPDPIFLSTTVATEKADDLHSPSYPVVEHFLYNECYLVVIDMRQRSAHFMKTPRSPCSCFPEEILPVLLLQGYWPTLAKPSATIQESESFLIYLPYTKLMTRCSLPHDPSTPISWHVFPVYAGSY